MRKFIAGCCCLIVGLQVLIGVPLAVCLIFYGMVQGGGPIAVQVQPSAFDPATIPPLNYSTPQPYVSGVPVAGPVDCVPALPPPVAASYSVPSSVAMPDPVNRSKRAEDPTASAAIAEVLERNGDPLEDTFVGAQSTQSKAADTPPAVAVSEPRAEALLPAIAPADSKARSSQLIDSLTCSVQRLYALATDYEDQGNFGRADQVRKLARDIREEVEIIRLQDSHRCVSAEATLDGPAAGANVAPKPAY